MSGVLVFVEQREGRIRNTSLEAVSEARRLADAGAGTEVTAVVPGSGVADLEKLGAYGADRVYKVDQKFLGRYQPEGYAQSIVAAKEKSNAQVILVAASAMGKDLAPRVAARLAVGLASDCTQLEWKDGGLQATRPVHAGKVIQTVRLTRSTALATLRPLAFSATEHRPGASVVVEDLSAAVDSSESRSTVTEIVGLSVAPG